MNGISTIMHRFVYQTVDFPVLAIDGVPIQHWIKSQIFDQYGNDQTHTLVPAQHWLSDDVEAKTAWKLLDPANKGSTVVPLLVCPDDRDLSCTVVVVEQVTDADHVVWKRFGLSTNHIGGVVTSVSWSDDEQYACFERKQFEGAFAEFERLAMFH